jgi:glycosyltransferase involved in cell wall biosynthesis
MARVTNNYLEYPDYGEFGFYSVQSIKRAIKKADVLHFHDVVTPFIEDLKLEDLIKEKLVAVTYHSTLFRHYYQDMLKEAHSYDAVIFLSTLDLAGYAEGEHYYWLPVIRNPAMRGWFRNEKRKQLLDDWFGKKLIILHSTTSFENRGSYPIIRVLNRLAVKYEHVVCQVVTGKPWQVYLQKIAEADIFVDQIEVGMYGAGAIEAGMFGIPVVSYIPKDLFNWIEENIMPLGIVNIEPDEKSLEDALVKLIEDEDYRREKATQWHQYCLTLHSPQKIAKFYTDILTDKLQGGRSNTVLGIVHSDSINRDSYRGDYCNL